MNKLFNVNEEVELKAGLYNEISEKLWDFAELRFEEQKSSKLLIKVLKDEGFNVEENIAKLPTAFVGSYGDSGPIIAILGEYDALSGLSQVANSVIEEPVVKGGNGHGCGHNLLGTGAIAAAITVKKYIEKFNIDAQIRFYGCPAEEGGSGKTYMVREGVFNDVDIAFCWHPTDLNGILKMDSLANYQVYYKFKGRASHAAATPHLGRSALDAVELMNSGVNYLREHIIQEARLHYAVTNAGGISPNVVQAEAEVLYLIRAPEINEVDRIFERVNNIAKGAALMTGTEVEIIFDKACSELISNGVLDALIYRKFKELGIPTYTDEEKIFAEKIAKTLVEVEKVIDSKEGMANWIQAEDAASTLAGSTDVGDVSWIVPTSQCMTACFALNTNLHTWQWVSMGRTSIAKKGMLLAAKVLSSSVIELLNNPGLIEKAKSDHKKELRGRTYKSPIPQHVQANIPK